MNFTTRMSHKELRATTVIAQVIAGAKTATEAATLLSVTDRTIRRMKAKVNESGVDALAHKSRGKTGNRRLSQHERLKIAKLLHDRYSDFGPTLAAEKLQELHHITHDAKTVRTLMIAQGLWQPHQRKHVMHRAWREPRDQFGKLIQYDGSYEHWLEGRGGTGEICLLAAIDDATGTVPQAMFSEHEGVLPTMGFWTEYIQEHGMPHAIYLDKFSTYRVNYGVASENQDTKTQFGRAMQQLGVELIFANSPQAKGRVERLFRTLQDRLIKELRLRHIDSVQEANQFLREEFLPQFNTRFGKTARKEGDAHQPLTAEQKRRLPLILCKQEERTIANDFTIPHGKRWYQLLPSPRVYLRPKDTVIIRTAPDGTVTLWVREKAINYRPIEKQGNRLAFKDYLINRTFLIPPHPDISNSR